MAVPVLLLYNLIQLKLENMTQMLIWFVLFKAHSSLKGCLHILATAKDGYTR